MNIYKVILVWSVIVVSMGNAELSASVLKSEHIMWGDLIELTIRVDEEQMITIDPPLNIQLGIPQQIDQKVDVLNTPGRLFIKALEPFEKTKIAIKNKQHGVVLIILSAHHNTPQLSDLVISTAKKDVSNQNIVAHTLVNTSNHKCNLNYVEMARWLLQVMYAPKRLLDDNQCFSQINVANIMLNFFKCQRQLLCGSGISAKLLGSWQFINGEWLHAIEIQNKTSQKVILDPRDINYQPHYLAVTFTHPWLDKSGAVEDTTVAVLITNQSLTNDMSEDK